MMMEGNKSYRISRMFSDFLSGHDKIKDVRERHYSDALDYEYLDKDTRSPRSVHTPGGFFYNMKENAHETRKVDSLSDLERALSWLVERDFSAVFHTMTRLRETMYEINRNVQEKSSLHAALEQSGSYDRQEVRRSLDAITGNDRKARDQVGSLIDDAMYLIDSPKYVLVDLIEINKDDDAILRNVYAGLQEMDHVYGVENTDEILRRLYSSDRIGFVEIARDSMIRQGFYEDAISANSYLPEEKKLVLEDHRPE